MQLPAKFDEFLHQPKTHNIFAGGRGGGKTRSIAEFIVEVMARTPLKIICGREVQKSLKESSFLVIREAIQRLGYSQQFKINESAGAIEGATGSRAVFIGLLQHTVDSIKSYEGFHWVWIEEAQSVSKRSLETLIPTLRTDGWFAVGNLSFPLRMFIYTMNPYTWEDPINLVLPDSRDDVRRTNINYYDNPWFPEALEQERTESKNTMTKDEYLRVWEGIPFDSAENAVMTRSQVFEAMEREASRDGGIVVGADIARFGDDRTVFYKREGFQVIDKVVLAKKDTQEVAIRLAEFAQGNKIVIDDTGVGGGVTDKLRSIGCNVVAVNFGGSPLDKKKYPDIISEMWFNLGGLIDQIGLPNDSELLAELSGRHYKYTADERRKVESKEEYKKRSGRRSPDLADALILCFYNREAQVVKMTRSLPSGL